MTAPTIEEAQEFYLVSSERGWAGGAAKIIDPTFPGFKVIELLDEDGQGRSWRYRDMYCVGLDGLSSGCIIIWCEDIPL